MSASNVLHAAAVKGDGARFHDTRKAVNRAKQTAAMNRRRQKYIGSVYLHHREGCRWGTEGGGGKVVYVCKMCVCVCKMCVCVCVCVWVGRVCRKSRYGMTSYGALVIQLT